MLDIDESVARRLIGEPNSSNLQKLFIDAFAMARRTPVTAPMKKAILSLTKEIAYVYSVRDVIAHKPCYTDGTQLTFHNTATHKKPEGLFRYECTAQQLVHLTAYTLTIAQLLLLLVTSDHQQEQTYVDAVAVLYASRDRLLLPKVPGEQSLNSNQKPKRPPRSSAK
jgi:hypothetical protein